MKKRLLALFITLASIFSMMILPVKAEEIADAQITELTNTCSCGCGADLGDVQWKKWNVNKDANVASGHYYLDGDYVQTQQAVVNSGVRVVLDLRGYKLTNTKDFRMILCYGYMAVLDSVGGGRLCGNTTGSGYGGVILVSTNETNFSAFELYSGTITLDVNNKGSRRGGLISVADTCAFRMYGGTVLNGTTYSTHTDYVDTKDDAGCIYGATGSNIEILGGQIIGGKSDRYGGNIYSQGTTVLKNCALTGGYAENAGGNICQNGGSLTVENATIRDGVCEGAAYGGGNICLMGSAVLNLKNSTLRNGYSNYHGGNIYMGTSSGMIENTVIEAGVAAARGNNLYGSTSATGLTLQNCDLPGDISYVGKGLSLKGQVKIGLLNSGLRLVYGTDKAVLDASALTEGSEIYVVANNHTFTDTSANAAYFKGGIRTLITETEEGLHASYAPSGTLGGYCPHCMERVVWTAYDPTTSLVQDCLLDSATDTDPACTGRHIESGHYYLGKSLSGMAQYYIGSYLSGQGTLATEDVVIDMAGYSITATGRAFYLRPKDAQGNANQLTLLNSYGNGKVSGSGAANQGGGVIYNEGGHLTVYGGKYQYVPVSGRNVTSGGVLYNSGTLEFHGGIFDGSQYIFTDASTTEKTYTYNGGAIHAGSGAARSMIFTAGAVLGGEANQGGALYVGTNATVTVTGGQFMGGRAVTNGDTLGCGGNIRIEGTSSNKNGKANLSGIAITGGYSESNSGNFSATYYAQIDLSDSYVADGNSKDYGGNIAIGANSTFANYENLIINKGTAARGANIYSAGTGQRANLIDCYVVDGAASNYGGNFYAGNGYLVVKGGVFDHGTAATYGGNIVANAGKTAAANYLKFQKDDKGNVPQITGGVAGTYGGNLYVNGVLELTDAFVHNGKAKAKQGQDIWYLASTSSHKAHKLEIGAGVTGNITMGSATGNLTAPYYALPVADTVCSTLNANIVLENVDNQPMLAAKDGMLYVGSVAVFNGAGECTWYAQNADAVAACDLTEYVRVYTDEPIALTKDCYVDINGHTVTVSGAYTLYGMDSAAHNGSDSTGKTVLAEEVKYVSDHTAPNGMRYIAVADGSNVTWHCLDMKVTSVSLRPGNAGLYYSAVWNLDSVMAQQVETFGIAVSLTRMPTAAFTEDVLYTQMTADQLQTGVSIPGAIIENIFSAEGAFEMDGSEFTGDAANMLRGQQKIYATPYVVLNDGTRLIADDPETEQDDVALSLRDVLTQMGNLVTNDPEHFRRHTPALRAFYAQWQGAMKDWQLNEYAFETPEEDDVLDILLIGNSWCYYYVEELHEMAKAAGVKMRVCNLYYSGCPMTNHVNWWLGGEKKYQYFEAVDGGKVQTNGVSLEWALQQREWDVMCLLTSSSEVRNYTVEESLAVHREPRNILYGYLRDQFPNADLYFQQGWSYDIGHTRDDGYVMASLEQQIELTARSRDIATGVCAENNVGRANVGDAWELYRTACNEAGISHCLTARLGNSKLTGEPHSGDGSHDGDIGGGQLLNAAVWFEILTGLDCRETGYVPVYTYGGESYPMTETMAQMLYEAAHKAVTEILPTYPENQ